MSISSTMLRNSQISTVLSYSFRCLFLSSALRSNAGMGKQTTRQTETCTRSKSPPLALWLLVGWSALATQSLGKDPFWSWWDVPTAPYLLVICIAILLSLTKNLSLKYLTPSSSMYFLLFSFEALWCILSPFSFTT